MVGEPKRNPCLDQHMDAADKKTATHCKGDGANKMGIVVFSGGTAANSLVDVFNSLVTAHDLPLTYVIPISDNGGSSSEIIRFVGGPSVGDVRSRLVRLISNDDSDREMAALKALFEHRLCGDNPFKARAEWLDIVEARHLLWTFVSSAKRELVRSVLNALNLELVKRARPASVFNFAGASVGNLFLTGARLFSGSFESAIYLFSIICSIPPRISVLPAINSNFTHHISAGLADGTNIVGQVAISHPSAPTSLPDNSVAASALTAADHDRIEDANLPGSLPVLRGGAETNSRFSKKEDEDEDLAARVQRLWYINPYGHEIWPITNAKVLDALRDSRAVIYSIGSLYTSIVPSLILRGVGQAIANPSVRAKVLVLNSRLDRETGPRSDPMTGTDFVRAIARAGAESWAPGAVGSDEVLTSYVTHLVYLEGEGAPVVHVEELEGLGIKCARVEGSMFGAAEGRRALKYDEVALASVLGDIIFDHVGR